MDNGCEDWVVLMYDKKRHTSILKFVEGMEIEAFAPTRITLRARKNRPSPQSYEVLLFPGYLFLRFNLLKIATTAVTAFPGAYGFIRFGDHSWPSTIPSSAIEKLKAAIKDYKHKLEHPPVVSIFESNQDRTVKFLVKENSEAARIAGCHEWLKQISISEQHAKRTKLTISF